MSNALDILTAVVFATVCSLLARSMTTKGKLPKWWFGIAIVPLLCWGMALAVWLFPRPVPDNWDPAVDVNTGRLDFIALVFFGAILPAAYLFFALPIGLVLKLQKTRWMDE